MMAKNSIKKEFDYLVHILKKYCLTPTTDSRRKIYFSSKYNSYIVKIGNTKKLVYGNAWNELTKIWEEVQEPPSGEDFTTKLKDFHNKFNADNPYRAMKLASKFKFFIYLSEDNFCFDIEENEVRINLIKVKMPDKITGNHNGDCSVHFERVIRSQTESYLNAAPNISVVTSLNNIK